MLISKCIEHPRNPEQCLLQVDPKLKNCRYCQQIASWETGHPDSFVQELHDHQHIPLIERECLSLPSSAEVDDSCESTAPEFIVTLNNAEEVKVLAESKQSFEHSNVRIVFNFYIEGHNYKLINQLINDSKIFKCSSIRSLEFIYVSRKLDISSFSQLRHLFCASLRQSIIFDKLEYLTSLKLDSTYGLNKYFDLNKDKLPNLKELALDLSNCYLEVSLPALEVLFILDIYGDCSSATNVHIKSGNDSLKEIYIAQSRESVNKLVIEGPLPNLTTLQLPINIDCDAESLAITNFPKLKHFSYSGYKSGIKEPHQEVNENISKLELDLIGMIKL